MLSQQQVKDAVKKLNKAQRKHYFTRLNQIIGPTRHTDRVRLLAETLLLDFAGLLPKQEPPAPPLPETTPQVLEHPLTKSKKTSSPRQAHNERKSPTPQESQHQPLDLSTSTKQDLNQTKPRRPRKHRTIPTHAV